MFLYLDDLRIPQTPKPWMIIRSYEIAVAWMERFGAPTVISFDHDLGEGVPSGYDLAKWMVEKDIDMSGRFLPKEFEFNVHSANPVGAENIRSLFDNYLRFKSQQPNRRAATSS